LRIDRGALLALALCACAFLIYAALGLASHRSLHTNAFDLSVFDYALWTTAAGDGVAYVPMFRHSLFAQHFMPALLVLAPLARVFDSPAYLILLQALFQAAAGLLLFRLASRDTTRGVALALTAAFLFSRRSYGAVTSVFYIESLEPLLVFGAVLAWSARRRTTYWVLVLLALACKEDVALYVAGFGLVIAATRRDRALGLATTAVAAIWLAAAVGVAIPYWRTVYGLEGTNPFLEGRYGGPLVALAARVLSPTSLARIVTVLSATGFLALLAPPWLAIVVPGLLVNLAAAPDTLQAALLGHYLWPILPWLFVAAAIGSGRFASSPLAARWLPLAVVVIALIDLPLPRALLRARWRQPAEARDVIRQLQTVPPDASVLAQPNLIPHLPRRLEMHAAGVYTAGQPDADYVLLTPVGDLWPFDERAVAARAARYAADPRYEQLADGPLFIFRRRSSNP
jgi:uncharacterized membrane protein